MASTEAYEEGRVMRRAIVALSAVLAFSGCATTDLGGPTEDLAKAGTATMQTVADFYGAMITTVVASQEEEILGDALHEAQRCSKEPMDEFCSERLIALRKLGATMMEDRARWTSALVTRQRLASEFSALYSALGGLAGDDLGQALQHHAPGLIDAINGVSKSPLPTGSAPLASELLKNLGKLLQNTALKHAEHVLETVVIDFKRFFDAEIPAWTTLATQWEVSFGQNVTYLLQLQLAGTSDASNRILKAHGLTAGSQAVSAYPLTQEGITVIESLRGADLARSTRLSASAAQSALAQLVAAHEQFPSPLSNLDILENWISKAQTYLELIAAWNNGTSPSP